jgi:hypothetical protein
MENILLLRGETSANLMGGGRNMKRGRRRKKENMKERGNLSGYN